MSTMTASEAWDNYVGEQTPAEFLSESRAKGLTTIEDAVAAYVEEYPRTTGDWTTWEDAGIDPEELADLLTEYLTARLGETRPA